MNKVKFFISLGVFRAVLGADMPQSAENTSPLDAKYESPPQVSRNLLQDVNKSLSPDVKYESPPSLIRKLSPRPVTPPKALDLVDDRDPIRIKAIKDGRRAFSKHLHAEAFGYFKIAANFHGGSALGMYYLGSMYCFGYGTAKNVELGLKFLQAAAEAGYYRACFDLGLRYSLGDDVTKDYELAETFFGKIFHINTKYQYHYGLILYRNRTGQDKIRGLELMIESAQQGYEVAQKVVRAKNLEADLASLKRDMPPNDKKQP